MKIAIVIPNDFSIVWFCEELVKALLSDKNNKIVVISDIHSDYEYGHYAKIMKEWGVEHIYIKFYRFMNPFKDLKYIISLFKILKKEKFDMVVNISTKPNVYGSIAAKFAKVNKIVCSVWGLGLTFADKKGIKSSLLRFIVQSLYRFACKVSYKIWFTNEIDCEYFISHNLVLKEKTILTKNYVNTNEYSLSSVGKDKITELKKELGLKDKNKVVILIARMSWAKGIREFVEAAEILRNELPMLKFLLVGPEDIGSSDRVPESYLRKNEGFDNFMWLGFRRDVKELYALSDLAVYPSYYREGGYPRGLTEPMSMGKPIITTDSIHCRRTIDDGVNGYLVPIKDSQSLAKAIRKIITDEEKIREFGKSSRIKVVTEFDEKKIIRELIQKII